MSYFTQCWGTCSRKKLKFYFVVIEFRLQQYRDNLLENADKQQMKKENRKKANNEMKRVILFIFRIFFFICCNDITKRIFIRYLLLYRLNTDMAYIKEKELYACDELIYGFFISK